MTTNIGEMITTIAKSSGFGMLIADPRYIIMIVIACVLLYLGIVKGFEPLLMVPIGFGMLLANLPLAGLNGTPVYEYLAEATHNGKAGVEVIMEDGSVMYQYVKTNGGLLYYLYQGVKLGIYPPLIFMGVGAMTDFGPLIANPKSLLLGAAAQLGIFLDLHRRARLLGFTPQEAGSIGIIGGADGPTAIYVTTKLAPHLLGPIAVAAYSYMALVPVIQPPIMKALDHQEGTPDRHGAASPGLQDGEDRLPHHGDHRRLPASALGRPAGRHADAGQPLPRVPASRSA